MNIEELELLDSRPASKTQPKKTPVAPVLKSSAKISSSEKITFYSSFSRLLRGGVPLLRALDLTSSQIRSDSFKGIISSLRASIQEGRTLGQSFESFASVFQSFEVSVIKAGEISGSLSESFLGLSRELKRQEEIKRKTKEAVAYPLFVLSAGIITLFAVLLFVIPRLKLVYLDFGGKLPLMTSIVLKMSDAAPFILAFFLLLIPICFFVIKSRANAGTRISERFPLIGELVRKLYLSRTMLLLATLLKSGIPMREAISLLQDSLPQKKDELLKLLESVSQGKSLSESLRNVSFIGDGERSLILASEESGTLPDALSEIAESSSAEFSDRVNTVLKILEPALILLIGLLVGFLVISMLLPIMQLDLVAGES